MHRGLTIVITVLVVMAGSGRFLRGADAVAEAKRKAAASMIADGKFPDALKLLDEVIAADPQYRDYMQVAKIYEKQGDIPKALDAYQNVVTLVPEHVRDTTAQRARTDALHRIKALDSQSQALDAAVGEFEKKLDALDKDATKAGDAFALRKVFRLRAAVWRAQGRTDRSGAEIQADLSGQDTGFSVTAGKTYLVRSVGTWRVGGVEGTADGGGGKPANGFDRDVSCLVSVVGGIGLRVPAAGEFTPQGSGKLVLVPNGNVKGTVLPNSSGSIDFLIMEKGAQ